MGACGRMGELVCQAVEEDAEFEICGRFDIDNIEDLDTEAPSADLVIDFSKPASLPHVAAFVRRTGAALVSGTTGFTAEELATFDELGKTTRVVWASNYSLGVAVLVRAVREAAAAVSGWDTEIVETHHNKKADAPSGTAKTLLQAVDPDGEYTVVSGREGFVGERPAKEIGLVALRGGTVAGTHEVHFFGEDEELCFTHRATSRKIFVAGAVACAHKLLAAEVGRHTFEELMLD